jgi:hypothetical protein
MKDQIAVLMQSLHRYKEGNTTIEEVDFNLQCLARKAGVETFGVIGETVQYSPFEHFLIDGQRMLGESVVVHMFGVCAIRENGSRKVLSRALVN